MGGWAVIPKRLWNFLLWKSFKKKAVAGEGNWLYLVRAGEVRYDLQQWTPGLLLTVLPCKVSQGHQCNQFMGKLHLGYLSSPGNTWGPEVGHLRDSKTPNNDTTSLRLLRCRAKVPNRSDSVCPLVISHPGHQPHFALGLVYIKREGSCRLWHRKNTLLLLNECCLSGRQKISNLWGSWGKGS